jgi:phosphoenolpyruvate carboxykinase (ATP)
VAKTADLSEVGISTSGIVRRNAAASTLVTEAIRRGDGVLAEGGPLVVETGRHTGRSPNDKYFVREPGSEGRIWWSATNQPLEPATFARLREKVADHFSERDLYVVDAFAGADPAYRIAVRVITPSPFHALFAGTMFIAPEDGELDAFAPDAVVLHAPTLEADPDVDGTRTGTFIALDPSRGEVLIGGTLYTGEIKKSVFTLMNDRLPLQGAFPMHCSANVGDDGDVAIFFGLSGTGKTTLSADPSRHLVGDDEHGWGDSGVFNFEAGCYAKMIRLSAEAEPEIFATTREFGTLLENVVLDDDGRLDLDSDAKTENTRGAYGLDKVSNSVPSKRAGHPAHMIFLTADAFGVMPPIARLNAEQAAYHFLSGFTARLAGTEVGVTEPAPVFSPCFGGPFLPQPPAVYARLLRGKVAEHRPSVWLVNTGWTGGAAGEGGHRMPIAETRALLAAVLSGRLEEGATRIDPVFGFEVPLAVPGVTTELLDPRSTWSDPAAYDAKAAELAGLFRENFAGLADVDSEVASGGPLQ